ncbi:YdeI/OmpD-associated family protein [Micromonospora polyrhachis]|uniref:Uncharacterized protein YdeI (YjbR/CyaY-like superfamily) n=1 Tax=Micromonospora polyrhachis TaxID=1282883 RepID=A0A7W7WMN7_9ACTN|nr:YdeI/OmpD-associated family protein [Micromonospora polyrhachis]MBB4956792.1 uncharacterized protein YdeI (YjbR/CyaY-like superfamily) [Micromonospora polyrhachis]
MSELPILSFGAQADFERWMEEHHQRTDGILLKFAKKGTAVPSINYSEALEVALCFGWIDGRADRLDDTYYLQRFTPRRKRSMWSKINTDRAEALITAKRMRPAGLAEVERAKADGRWDAAYHGPASAAIPDEITADEVATKQLQAMDSRNRYAYIHRFSQAKRPGTRAKLLQQLRAGHQFYGKAE